MERGMMRNGIKLQYRLIFCCWVRGGTERSLYSAARVGTRVVAVDAPYARRRAGSQ
jgi:hypothetical protein